MKKIFKNITAIVLITGITASVPQTILADTPSPWAVSQVQAAVELELVPEYLQSNYSKVTTRAEFCALAVMVYEDVRGEITGRITFTDTKDINVEKMAFIGVVAGVGNNMFAPNDSLTREQAAVMISGLAEAIGKSLAKQAPDFSDNGLISLWAFNGVGQVQGEGIMSGTGNNMFSPKSPYTREQSIITLKRTYDVLTAVVTPNSITLNSASSISQNLKKGMTDIEFNQAYDIAYNIAKRYMDLDRKEQLEGVFDTLASMRHNSSWEYSMEEKHYSDVYGFFVLKKTSCAGDVRGAALCLEILGIPVEHVNENQYSHQWARVKFDDMYVVLDVNAPYIGYEIEPYKHPLIG